MPWGAKLVVDQNLAIGAPSIGGPNIEAPNVVPNIGDPSVDSPVGSPHTGECTLPSGDPPWGVYIPQWGFPIGSVHSARGAPHWECTLPSAFLADSQPAGASGSIREPRRLELEKAAF